MTITLSVPTGFVPIPLGDSSEARKAATDAVIAAAGDDLPDRESVAAGLSAAGKLLREAGALLAGVFVPPSSGPEHYVTLTWSIGHLPAGGPELGDTESLVEYARALADVISQSNPLAVVQYRDLGCGPTVLVARSTLFRSPDSDVDDDPTTISTEQVQAIIPLWDGHRLLLVDVSSSTRDHWAESLEIALEAIDRIRIDPDDEPT
ncbi:hypothetical protein [Rhodococcus sp. NPDC049939]|uniref:hypothetical protein n=1 Tax=Rhodococcus sp. NPDC049939 TaxID=3155511 RepID=UPI0033E704F9